ncbi:hypothetical protein GGS21DRAFT_490907 [Xylaria nigripes]|nr:hypothetical protein GGS21DRAFT_490907 [Xylaria nigripes]
MARLIYFTLLLSVLSFIFVGVIANEDQNDALPRLLRTLFDPRANEKSKRSTSREPEKLNIFDDSKPFLDAAAYGLAGFLKRAGKDINQELTKFDKRSKESDEELDETAAFISMLMSELGDAAEDVFGHAAEWTEQANQDLQEDPVGTLAKASWDAAKIAAVVAANPWAPVLNTVGLGVGAGGSAAAFASSKMGKAAAASALTMLRSEGAREYGRATMNTLARGGAAALEVGKRIIEQSKKSDLDDGLQGTCQA